MLHIRRVVTRTPCGCRGFQRSVGIVGMPNVGKSTLFNALTRTEVAQAANYPFCTIDPNVARVAVPDERVRHLAEVEKSKRVIETQVCSIPAIEMQYLQQLTENALNLSIGSSSSWTSLDLCAELRRAKDSVGFCCKLLDCKGELEAD